jgi:Ca2+ transporting ATPase
MGGANNICSDKTGTLTKNLMTVTKIYVERNWFASISEGNMKDNTARLISLGVCVNSNAQPKVEIQSHRTDFVQIGNKTECALLEMAFKFGYDFRKIRNKEKNIRVFPFSSDRKRMTTVYKDNKNIYSFTKGAPDFMIDKCTRFIAKDGSTTKINAEFTKELQDTITQFASESLRTILLTYREFN